MKSPITPIEEKTKPQIKFATELTVLEKTFAGAVQFLKSTKVDSSANAKSLFELPWFLVLGGPQTGKSSLLAHSGLNFILTKKSTVSGHVIPTTRHCDLWVSREAVFFDTSGQFTLHDAVNQGSAQLWESFLDLLFKEKKEPIQGILLTLSLERLALQSKEEQSWHFQNISARLEELKSRQTHLAPIYLLLTKADCLAGFGEYFDDLSPEEREQPWGFSFNEEELNSAQTLLDTFTLKFNGLIQNLNERLMARLHSERDWHRRSAIKDFPLQIESLKKTLSYFLHKQLDNFTALSTFVLRGIYFTSAIPEEYVVDRLLKPLSQGFSLTHYTRPILAPQRQAREPFFLKNLFKKIILNDQKIFVFQKQLSQFSHKLWRRRTAVAAMSIAIVGTLLYWGYYISQNITHVAVAQKAITRYQFLTADMPTKDSSPQQSFSALSSLFNMQHAIEKAHLPKFLQWVSHGQDLSLPQQQTLQNGLQKILSWQLSQILTQELAKPTPSTSVVYGALKTAQAINHPNDYSKDYAKKWLLQYWQTNLQASNEEMAMIDTELKRINALPTITLNSTLVAKANDFLNQQPAERLVTAMLNTDYALDHASLIMKLPTDETLFQFKSNASNYNIPPQFTQKNFVDIYQQQLPYYLTQLQQGNSIVTNFSLDAANEDAILQKARDEYMTQYIATWQTVTQSIHLQNSTDFNKIQTTLAQMLNPHSTLSKLLNTIQMNTHVLYQNMPTPISLAFEEAAIVPAQTLDNDWYQDLNRLSHLVQNVNAAPNPTEKAFSLAEYRMTHVEAPDILSDLQDKSAVLPAPWQAWSQQILADTWQGLLAQSQTYINTAWQQQVLPSYNQAIAHHFPVDPNAKETIALNEFERFFAPQGTFSSFMKQYLNPFIDKENPTQWKVKTRDNMGLALSADTLQALRQTDMITQLFFNGDNHIANVQLALTPVLPDTIKDITVAVNGQTTTFDNKKAPPISIAWPATNAQQAQLSVTVHDVSGETHRFDSKGLWAWVKLLNDAKLQTTTTPSEIVFNLPLQGHDSVQYTLSSLTTPVNPFIPGILQGAMLPETMDS